MKQRWRVFSTNNNTSGTTESDEQTDIAIVEDEYLHIVLHAIRKANWWRWNFYVYALLLKEGDE